MYSVRVHRVFFLRVYRVYCAQYECVVSILFSIPFHRASDLQRTRSPFFVVVDFVMAMRNQSMTPCYTCAHITFSLLLLPAVRQRNQTSEMHVRLAGLVGGSLSAWLICVALGLAWAPRASLALVSKAGLFLGYEHYPSFANRNMEEETLSLLSTLVRTWSRQLCFAIPPCPACRSR